MGGGVGACTPCINTRAGLHRSCARQCLAYTLCSMFLLPVGCISRQQEAAFTLPDISLLLNRSIIRPTPIASLLHALPQVCW